MGIPVTVFLLAVMLFTYIRSPQFIEDSCTSKKEYVGNVTLELFSAYLAQDEFGKTFISHASVFGLQHFDLNQWLLSLFNQASKRQFAYQIVSLLWKGTLLEVYIGSRRFASIILKLLLLDEGMMLMAWQGSKLWGVAGIYPFICHGHFLRMVFCMYGFLLPGYQNQNILIMVAIPLADLTVIYILYPMTSLSSAVSGTLSGLLWSYGPQLMYGYWKKVWSSCSSRVIEMPVGSDTRELIWKCEYCRSENGVFLDVCDSCGIVNGRSASDSSIMNSPQSSLISRMPNPELDRRDSVWNCKSCTFENEVFVPVCEICGAPNLMFD